MILLSSLGVAVAFYFYFKALRHRSPEGDDNLFLLFFWGAFAPLRYFTHTGNRYRFYALVSILFGSVAAQLVSRLARP